MSFFYRICFSAFLALFSSASLFAEEGHVAPERQAWSFSGPFGLYDQRQLQRGFQVYREVCSACHSIDLLHFRNLSQAGGPQFSEDQIKTLAETYKIQDGPNDVGEMFERPGRLSDKLPAPFPNPEFAKTANGGALPPDLSLIAKARSYSRGFPWFLLDVIIPYQEHGVDYIVSLLTGYTAPPADFALTPTTHYNRFMPGHRIAMAPPLSDGQIQYSDGSPQTIRQYAVDVGAFLMWAAEPHLNARKRMGFQVLAYILALTLLLFLAKKKLWRRIRD